MNIDTILRLLKNSGFRVLGTDGTFIHLEDPSCIIRSFETFTEYAWIAVTAITGVLLFGWAISMIRGAKTTGAMFINLRNLTLMFGALAAVKPIVNLVWGGDVFANGCKTISVQIADVQKILDARNLKLAERNEDDLYEEFDIYDSGATQMPNHIPYSELPLASGGDLESIPVTISDNPGIAAGAYNNSNNTATPMIGISGITATVSNGAVIYTNADGTRFKRTGGTLAWRHNNPGNIIWGTFARSVGAVAQSGRFAVFPDEATGRAAIGTLLRGKSYNNLTVGAAISKYAPPFENDTAAYHRHIEKTTGLSVNTPMNSLNDAQMESVIKAIAIMEGWKAGVETRL